MKFSVIWIAIVVGTAYAALCAYLYVVQRSLIYFPVGENHDVAADDVRIRSANETLQVWRRFTGQAKALIYFGGNAEDVALNLPSFARHFPDYALYLVNYRGYGASTGSPTEAGLYADALNVYTHVKREHDRVSVIGRSLGSGVATYLAAHRPLDRLALVTPFDSLVNVAKSAYPFVPVSQLMLDQYDSVGRAPRITASTLIVIAGRDEFIAARHSEALATGFEPAQVQIRVIDDAGHNSIDEFPAYAEALTDFFRTPAGSNPALAPGL